MNLKMCWFSLLKMLIKVDFCICVFIKVSSFEDAIKDNMFIEVSVYVLWTFTFYCAIPLQKKINYRVVLS